MAGNPIFRGKRHDGALLAGVCAGIARTFKWNVWVLRVLFVGLLAIKTMVALTAYAVLALAIHLLGNETLRGVMPKGNKASDGLTSPELSRRSERIADLERQFRELDRKSHL